MKIKTNPQNTKASVFRSTGSYVWIEIWLFALLCISAFTFLAILLDLKHRPPILYFVCLLFIALALVVLSFWCLSRLLRLHRSIRVSFAILAVFHVLACLLGLFLRFPVMTPLQHVLTNPFGTLPDFLCLLYMLFSQRAKKEFGFDKSL